MNRSNLPPSNKSRVIWPGDTERISIVGTTGSGKTHAAMYQLSTRDYDRKPWVIFDFKGDPLLNEVEGAQHISLDWIPRHHAGIYIVHPSPGDEIEVEDLLWRIWAHENIGIYIDEGVMIGNHNNAYRSCLTQGRSKHIPMIVLCQRPVWIDPFTFSESEFFQVFDLGYRKDRLKVEEFVPFDLSAQLPERYSYYYMRKQRQLLVLSAMPDRNAILDTFDMKLRKLTKVV